MSPSTETAVRELTYGEAVREAIAEELSLIHI